MIASATGGVPARRRARTSSSIKVKLHGELHALPSGTRKRDATARFEELPADAGYLSAPS